MLFTNDVLRGIRDGRITLAFRRWTSPRAKAGVVHLTPAGLVEIVSVRVVKDVDPAELRKAGHEDVDAFRRELDRWPGEIYRVELRYAGEDPRIARRASTSIAPEELESLSRDLPLLRLIAERPGTRAAELAAELGRSKEKLKRDVRALKELGLTESLGTGYRVSPRGRALLAQTKS